MYSKNNNELQNPLYPFSAVIPSEKKFDYNKAKQGAKLKTNNGCNVEVVKFDYYENPFDRPNNNEGLPPCRRIIAIITNKAGYSRIQVYNDMGHIDGELTNRRDLVFC